MFGCRRWLASAPGMAPDLKLSLVGAKLSRAPAVYYMSLVDTSKMPTDVDAFLDALEARFGEVDPLTAARRAWDRERQGGRPVMEFQAVLQRLLLVKGMQDVTPAQQVHRFHEGLDQYLKEALVLKEFDTLEDIALAAHKFEGHMATARGGARRQPRSSRIVPGLLLLQEACHVLLPLLNILLLLLESCHSCKHTSKLRHMGWLCWQACCTLVHN